MTSLDRLRKRKYDKEDDNDLMMKDATDADYKKLASRRIIKSDSENILYMRGITQIYSKACTLEKNVSQIKEELTKRAEFEANLDKKIDALNRKIQYIIDNIEISSGKMFDTDTDNMIDVITEKMINF